jgi:hypothetical protein
MTKSVSELSSDVQLLTATFPAADVVQMRMALVMKGAWGGVLVKALRY